MPKEFVKYLNHYFYKTAFSCPKFHSRNINKNFTGILLTAITEVQEHQSDTTQSKHLDCLDCLQAKYH